MESYTAGKTWKIEKKQQIMDAAFRLFAENGIAAVSMPEVADAGNVSRATLFRYFSSKLELAVAVGTQKWEEYITWHESLLSQEEKARMSGADHLRFYMDAFLDLYRNHGDILRFNYSFNSFLCHEAVTRQQKGPYIDMVGGLAVIFHEIYEKGAKDGTLNTDLSEPSMFSATFHIMLAAVTRYAVGLVYVPGDQDEPEKELIMLEELLLSRFIRKKGRIRDQFISD